MCFNFFSLCVSLVVLCALSIQEGWAPDYGGGGSSSDEQSCRSLPCVRAAAQEFYQPACLGCDKQREFAFGERRRVLSKVGFLSLQGFPSPPLLPCSDPFGSALRKLCRMTGSGCQPSELFSDRSQKGGRAFEDKVLELREFLDGKSSERLVPPAWSAGQNSQRKGLAYVLDVVYCSRFEWKVGDRLLKRSLGKASSVPGIVKERLHVSLRRDFSPIDLPCYKENDFLGHARVVDPKEIVEQTEYLQGVVSRNLLELEGLYKRALQTSRSEVSRMDDSQREIAQDILERLSVRILSPLKKYDFTKCAQECAFVRNCGIVDWEYSEDGKCAIAFSDRVEEEGRLFTRTTPTPTPYVGEERSLGWEEIKAVLDCVPVTREEELLVCLALLSSEELITFIYGEIVAVCSEARGRKGHLCVCFSDKCSFCVRRAERGGQFLATRCLSRHIFRLAATALRHDAGIQRQTLATILPLAEGLARVVSPMTTLAGCGELKKSGILDREFLLVEQNVPPEKHVRAPGAVLLGELLSIWSQKLAVHLTDSHRAACEDRAKRGRSAHYNPTFPPNRRISRERSAHAGPHASSRPFM